MLELLAIPGWQTPETTLESWVDQLSAQGNQVVVSRESTGVSWVEVASLRLRGYVVLQGSRVEAINFELAAPDPAPAMQLLESSARILGWELHADDPDDSADDDDED